MANQDFVRGFEVCAAYGAIRKVLESNVLNSPSHPLFEAGVTSLLINLNDLLQKAKVAEQRICFTDHVIIPGRENSDVTDLIREARNAACHLTSAVHSVGWGRLRMVVMAGYCPKAIVTPTDTFGCDYADDISIQYGPIRVYLKRHALRALDAVQAVLPVE